MSKGCKGSPGHVDGGAKGKPWAQDRANLVQWPPLVPGPQLPAPPSAAGRGRWTCEVCGCKRNASYFT
eukprot:6074271-Pyramimonas_sp.AAC.1